MWSCGERAWPRRGAALLGGLLLMLVLLAQPASAHALLVDSDPASGATAAAPPRVVRLWFSEDIAPRFGSARLVDRDGRAVGGTRVIAQRGDPRLLTLELPALQAGTYGVLWQVLAENDGHTTSGVVVFAVGEGSRPLAIAAPGSEAVGRPADVARRWLGVCLLAGLIGALAVAGFVLGRAASAHPAEPLIGTIRSARRRLLTFAACCAALGAIVGVADLVVEVARQAPAVGGSRSTVVQLLGATRWGHLWIVHEAALLALALLAFRLRTMIGGPHRRAGQALAAGAGVLVLAIVSVEAAGSHAAALEEARATAVAADALHILTACLWLGALPALVLMMWPQRGVGGGLADLLMASRRPFTGLAATSVGLLVVTGLYSAGREVETVDGLWTTTYGRALLVKSALLLVVGALGLVNSARLHGWCPRWLGSLGRRVAAMWPSRRLVVIEAGAGVVLLIVVGVLLETAPARGHAKAVATATPAAAETGSAAVGDLVVTVSVTPNQPGMNGFTVLAASSRRPPLASVDGVALELAMAGGTSTVDLQPVAPGRWFGTGQLDQSGRLRMEAVVRRAGKRLAVPVSWWVGQVGQVPAQQVTAPSGRRLAPFVDGLALSLLAGALVLGAGWLVLVRRRRRRPDAVPATRSAERVLEVMR